MLTKITVIASVIGLSLGMTPAARAGGGSWEFEGVGLNAEPVLVSGEPVHAYANLWLEGIEKHGDRDIFWAGPDEGPFFGYIIQRRGPNWGPFPPPSLPEGAIYVGKVEFEQTAHPETLRATLDFVMPDLEPGDYGLLHCNEPCTRQIGDVMSTRITIVEDKGQAILADRLNRSERSFFNLRARSANRMHKLETQVSRLSDHNASMEEQVATLAREVEAQPASPPATPPWVPLTVGAGVALLVDRSLRAWSHRRPRSLPAGEVGT